MIFNDLFTAGVLCADESTRKVGGIVPFAYPKCYVGTYVTNLGV